MNPSNPMSTGTTLYYPYIHVRSLAHLKAGLIYWDRVRRIVPLPVRDGDYAQNDDDDARMLVDEGLLVSTDPAPYADATAKRFFEHIEPLSSRFQIDLDTAHDLAIQNGGIHIEKLGYGVLNKLHDLGLAHQIGDWVSMETEVGAFYMFCLASEMSKRMAAPLLAESTEDASLGQSLLFEPDAASIASKILLRVGIKLPSPTELQNISTRDFAEFAVKYATERLHFREEIERLVKQVQSTDDQNAIDDYLDTQATNIRTAVTNLRKTLDELNAGAIGGIARITVPAGASIALAVLPISPVAAAILAATGLAISAVACYAETRGKLRQAKTSSPYHYLVSIENELGTKTNP